MGYPTCCLHGEAYKSYLLSQLTCTHMKGKTLFKGENSASPPPQKKNKQTEKKRIWLPWPNFFQWLQILQTKLTNLKTETTFNDHKPCCLLPDVYSCSDKPSTLKPFCFNKEQFPPITLCTTHPWDHQSSSSSPLSLAVNSNCLSTMPNIGTAMNTRVPGFRAATEMMASFTGLQGSSGKPPASREIGSYLKFIQII